MWLTSHETPYGNAKCKQRALPHTPRSQIVGRDQIEMARVATCCTLARVKVSSLQDQDQRQCLANQPHEREGQR